jgi:DNA recombination protein RmuC
MELPSVLLAIVIFCLVLWIILQGRRRNRQLDTQALLMIQQHVEALRHQVQAQQQAMTQHLQAMTGQVGNRLDTTARLVGEVSQSLGALTRATEQIYQVGKDITTLQDILQSPKLRGNLGEFLLYDMLAQVLPAAFYRVQHRFRSGDIVDALILIGNRQVPVDAKFPLENFRRLLRTDVATDQPAQARRRFLADTRRHIDAIASKYILPDEGTYDFALMYIPAENVYYEVMLKGEDNSDDLLPYALQRKVFPVSPVSLYAYLQTIVLGLRGLQLEESAQEVLQHLARLRRDTGLLRDAFDVLGRHLGHAHNKYDEVGRLVAQLEGKLLALEPERRSDTPGRAYNDPAASAPES